MEALELRASAISEVGLCKSENQDRILALIGEGFHGDFGLFMVADGMGGQRGGAQAAEIATRECEGWWNCVLPKSICGNMPQLHASVLQSLTEVAYRVNELVMELGRQMGSFPGTTLSLLFIYGTAYSFVHLGDSRIYKAGEQLVQITPDDTWVAQQIRKGNMSEAEAQNHPNRHMLTQCAGSGQHICIHSGQGKISSKEAFILCSDGFYNHLKAEEILSLVIGRDDTDQQLYDLMERIYARGATDNFSAIIVAL